MAEQVHVVYFGAPGAANRTVLHICKTKAGAEHKRQAEIIMRSAETPTLTEWYAKCIVAEPFTLGD